MLAGVGQLDHALRDDLRRDHGGVDHGGVSVAEDMLCFDDAAVGLHAADGLVVVKEDLLGGAVKPGVAAHGAEALQHAGGQLVAGFVRDPRAVADVEVYHVGVLQIAQPVGVNGEVAPVGVHNVLGQGGHLQGLEDLVDAVAAHLQKVGKVLHHVLVVRLAVDGEGVVAGVQTLLADGKEVLDGFATAGDQLLHAVGEGLHPAGEDRVDMSFPVAGRGDDAEVFRHDTALERDAVFLHHGVAAVAGVFGRAPFAELMQRRLEFKTASAETGGTATGEIVALDEQGLFPRQRHSACRSQTAVAGANDYRIVFWHIDSSF